MQTNIINKELEILHDSKLIAIEDDLATNSVILSFISEETNKIYITLKNVINSRCSDWKFGNIVLDASVIVHPKRLRDLLIFVDDLSDLQIEKKAYLNLLERINKKEIFIFELNPSYGAYYVCVCESIKIEI